MIPYPWKRDTKSLPDNRSLALKRLQGTERPEIPWLDSSLTLGEQMTEMVKMNFCRKLSEDKVKKYKGPVHYIPHHAVITPRKSTYASQDAFETCAYTCQRTNGDKYQVRLIAAKSRVAPLKQLCILLLELQAASRLAKSIEQESRVQFKSVKLFTDSSITPVWLQSPSRSFTPFVS